MRTNNRTLLAGVTLAGLMGGTALAQQVILVPQPSGGEQAGAGSEQRFILVPAPRYAPDADAQGHPDSAMAMELYRRGYQQGVSDAERAGAAGQQIDPAAIESIGRELFERGYILGMMQAQLQATQSAAQQGGQQGGQTQAAQQHAAQQGAGQNGGGRQAGGAQGGAQAGQAPAGQAPAGQAQAQQRGIEAQTFERPIGQAMDQTQANQQAQAGQQAQADQQPTGGQGGSEQQGEQPLIGGQVGATAQTDMPEATIRAEDNEQFGQYLVDGNGRAVYLFTTDTPGEGYSSEASSSCQDECAEAWPPVLTRSTPVEAGTGVQSELIGTFQRGDGTTQLTYGGWPLYHYAEDAGADQPTGQDVESFGGEWYLVTPEGKQVGHN
jgi:predicted lipoprotein with Yx(FWY)xxD motif